LQCIIFIFLIVNNQTFVIFVSSQNKQTNKQRLFLALWRFFHCFCCQQQSHFCLTGQFHDSTDFADVTSGSLDSLLATSSHTSTLRLRPHIHSHLAISPVITRLPSMLLNPAKAQ